MHANGTRRLVEFGWKSLRVWVTRIEIALGIGPAGGAHPMAAVEINATIETEETTVIEEMIGIGTKVDETIETETDVILIGGMIGIEPTVIEVAETETGIVIETEAEAEAERTTAMTVATAVTVGLTVMSIEGRILDGVVGAVLQRLGRVRREGGVTRRMLRANRW
jgi:hypothetical protein